MNLYSYSFNFDLSTLKKLIDERKQLLFNGYNKKIKIICFFILLLLVHIKTCKDYTIFFHIQIKLSLKTLALNKN